MSDALKQAAKQALLDCLPKVGETEARFTMVETKDLRTALAAPQPAAPQPAQVVPQPEPVLDERKAFEAWNQGFAAGENWVEAKHAFWETHEYGDSPKPEPNPYKVKS